MLADYKGYSGVYRIINKINGKCYVGSCSCFYTRKSAHMSLLNNNKHHSLHLQRAWNKYGEGSFEFELIITIPKIKHYLLGIEQWHIDNSNSEYNICKIAGSNLGRIFSEEHKLRLSQSLKGKKRTPEQKLQQRLVKLGTKHTQETKNKVSKIVNKIKGNRVGDNINKEQILQFIDILHIVLIINLLKLYVRKIYLIIEAY